MNKPKTQTLRDKVNLVDSLHAVISGASTQEDTLQDLFMAMQKSELFEDSKLVVDLVPKERLRTIKKEYSLAKDGPDFDLREFINRHFYELVPDNLKPDYNAEPGIEIGEHIHNLWQILEKHNPASKGSLIGLPHPYVVPGGRFMEQFYWDSYFIMLGLAADAKWKLIEGMIDNFVYLIEKYGFIPSANRTYFLSRSQPPFFSHMVKLLANHKGEGVYLKYLPYLIKEYGFWMKGSFGIDSTKHKSRLRLVKMPDGSYLNRYYDNKTTPRPESMKEDNQTALNTSGQPPNLLFLHLRAGAESGWDFSSRWFSDGHNLSSIHTAEIVPVDLNCLLYDLESTIAEALTATGRKKKASQFEVRAERRRLAIIKYFWNEEKRFFMDYDFYRGQQTESLTLAGLFPLFSAVASQEQADSVAQVVERDFLVSGGLKTTLKETGQQWDAPNGWAPLQWIAAKALDNYGHTELATTIKQRWGKLNLEHYSRSRKLVEKYNVCDKDSSGGGGEYKLQDGFGWTNGILADFLQTTDL